MLFPSFLLFLKASSGLEGYVNIFIILSLVCFSILYYDYVYCSFMIMVNNRHLVSYSIRLEESAEGGGRGGGGGGRGRGERGGVEESGAGVTFSSFLPFDRPDSVGKLSLTIFIIS